MNLKDDYDPGYEERAQEAAFTEGLKSYSSGVLPVHPKEWKLLRIQTALKKEIPPSLLKKLPGKGNAVYIPWYTVNRILDKYAPGWTWEIKDTQLSHDRIFLIGRLTIPTKDGNIYREASGTEELKKQTYDSKMGRYTQSEIAYGDPSSNAESMAFRRCAARFGLGLYLYKS